MDVSEWHLPLASTVLALIVLLTCPAIASAAVQLRNGKPKDRFYEDADGHSTPEAISKFSSKASKMAMLLFSTVGSTTSLVRLVHFFTQVREKGAHESVSSVLLAVAWVSSGLM